jgi:hypothetical protein
VVAANETPADIAGRIRANICTIVRRLNDNDKRWVASARCDMTKIILWVAFLLAIVYCMLGNLPVRIPVGVVSIVLFMWGCGLYARSKGYSPVLGAVLGILNVVGLLIVAALPDRRNA